MIYPASTKGKGRQISKKRLTPILVFDVTGIVIKRLKRNIIVSTLAKRCGMPYPLVYEEANSLLPELESSKVNFAEYINNVLRRVNCARCTQNETSEILFNFLRKSTKANNKTVNLIRAIRARGYEVYALTNSFPEQVDYLRSKKWASVFNRILSSSDFGVRKPSPAIFTELVKTLRCSFDDIIFIDDDPQNLEGATKAGITRLILFRGLPSLRGSIEKELGGTLSHQ
jgi:HAD superfamily hydrolase (TIGR01509 family)